MKRAIIIHCWDGYPKYCWYPQTKKELEEADFNVQVPLMPDNHSPKLSTWLPKLKETVKDSDQDLFLIGHSSGCITILRYLETLKADQKVGGVILVAPFTDDLGFEELKNFFQTPIDFAKIKTKSDHFVTIFSDNDPYVPLTHTDVFKEKLNAKVIIKHNMGHFSGPADDTQSVTSLPDVTKTVIEIEHISKRGT